MRGATYSYKKSIPRRTISIHAPHAGCDCGNADAMRHDPYFNPRTPCGVRLGNADKFNMILLFQSTHPMRGATTGRDRRRSRRYDFNPRTPCGVRRRCHCSLTSINPISIHAPHAGCDTTNPNGSKVIHEFQSTHPMRGATW